MKSRCFLFALLSISLLIGGCEKVPPTDLDKGPEVRLNDTGVDWCANTKELYLECPEADHPGQDAEYGRDLLAKQGELEKVGAGHAGFDFTKLDEDGEPLPAEAKKWACVRDNHTGLEWELKTTDGGLQHNMHTYTWYNPDPKRNGGKPGQQNGGKCQGSACDTLGYTEAINEHGLCGHNDWRVPTLLELISILDYGRVGPALDPDYFPNTAVVKEYRDKPYLDYWSADPMAEHDKHIMIISFYDGDIFYSYKTVPTVYLRLVRDAP